MKSKIATYIKVSKAILVGTLCLALSLPPSGLSWAQAAPAAVQSGCPEGKSLDSQRMANYRRVVVGYLQELEALCDNPHPAVREYLAQRVRDYLVFVEADFLSNSPPEGKLREEFYPDLRDAVNRIIADFNQQAQKSATGELAFGGTPDEKGNYSQAWLAIKNAESIYPKDIGTYQRNPVDWSADRNYAAQLQTRNNSIVIAFKKYLDNIKGYAQSTLVVPAGQKAQEKLFKQARELASYAWMLNKWIPGYRANYYQAKYERDNAFYQAYLGFYDQLYSGYTTTHQLIKYVGSGAWLWREESRSILGRTGLRSYLCKVIVSLMDYGWCAQGKAPYVGPLQQWSGATGGLVDSWTEVVPLSNVPTIVSKHLSDIAGIRNNFISSWPAPGVYAPCDYQQALSRCTQSAEAENNYIKAQQAALENLISNLNSALQEFNAALPYRTLYQRGENNDTYFLTGGPNPNQGPYIVDNASNRSLLVLSKEEKISSEKIRLTVPKDKLKDPENDTLHYRWVIIGMPETDNAKSQKYALYQILSNEETCQFQPDLAGKWTLALEANDQELGLSADDGTNLKKDYALVEVNAIRHILWIQHSNGPYDPKTGLGIELVLYQPIGKIADPLESGNSRWNTPLEDKDPNLTKPEKDVDGHATQWGGSYYLETAHGKAGVYLNYNDDGNPVDEDNTYTGTSAAGQYCFKVFVHPYQAHHEEGLYDGTYGSTDIVNPKINGVDNPNMFYDKPKDFKLSSASDHKCLFPIHIEVLDPQITELVLSSEDCSYGQRLANNRRGMYYIQQWLDHSIWINVLGRYLGYRFREIPIPNGVPDWAERRVAEVLNQFPEVLPYVERIKSRDYYGGAYTSGTKYFTINPYWKESIRHNLPLDNSYGFYTSAAVDAIARHEAHHAFWNWTVCFYNRDKAKGLIAPFPNKDKDWFPATKAGGMFEYLEDSESNIHGPCGASEDMQSFPRMKNKELVYKGDEEEDSLRSKHFIIRLNKDEYNAARTSGLYINIDLSNFAKDLPISNVSGAFLMNVRKKADDPLFTWYVQDRIYCEVEQTTLYDQQTKHPKLRIMFYIDMEWERLLSGLEEMKRKGEIYDFDLVGVAHVHSTHMMCEYDASRVQPGVYTGKWRRDPWSW
jgi:hypothetical protein